MYHHEDCCNVQFDPSKKNEKMLSTPKTKSDLFLASSLCDGLEDNNIRQVATLLLNKDADPNVLLPIHGVTPFHLVIGNESEEFAEEVTKLFLRHGGNPNVRSMDGMTPVHIAAAWGRTNILQLLLANGGDPLCLDDDGRTPFHYAFDGKYFKTMKLLANYCESTQDEDDKPKYNLVLDKIVITNRNIIAEYITSKDTLLDTDMTQKNVLTDSSNCKPNSSMVVGLSYTSGISSAFETEYKSPNKINIDKHKNSYISTKQIQTKSLQTDKEEVISFVDFDSANLRLSKIMQKEKCLVSPIINRFSSLSINNCTIDENLHNYQRNKREKNSITTSNSDTSLHIKENARYKYHQKKIRNSLCKTKNNFRNKDILKFKTPNPRKQCSKYDIQDSIKRKCKNDSDKISVTPIRTFDNSIISMSPNFKAFSNKKEKSICKTPLTPNIYNDFIISKSPNFITFNKNNRHPMSSHVDSLQAIEKSPIHKSKMYNSEFKWHKKHIAQSTPRRKKRPIYKFYSGRKKCNLYRYESDATSDEFISHNILNPVDLNKTIFSQTTEDTIHYDVLDTSSELSPNFNKYSKIKRNKYNKYLAIKLNEKRYDENDTADYNNDINLLNTSSGINHLMKENESINSFNNNKKYTASENNEINEFVTKRKNIISDKTLENIVDINRIKCTIDNESDSLRTENFVNCVDCDTKRLLNEDVNMNMSKICNLYAQNWYSNRFHICSFYKTFTENDLFTTNVPVQCSNQIYLPHSQKLCSSRSVDAKEARDLSNTEDSSSLLYVSTQEYKYEDPEEGVVLLERRICITPFNASDTSDIASKMAMSGVSTSRSVSQNLPEEILFIEDADLRQQLKQFGDKPGPITDTTRHLYKKRLLRLRKVRNANPASSTPNPQNMKNKISRSNNRIKFDLKFGEWLSNLDTYKNLEKQAFQEFIKPDPNRRWREGTSKTSFTYLLLDPRITQDLPNRNAHLTKSEAWSIFLTAIFYIGKGKRIRPFSHLYDAFNAWVGKTISTDKKTDNILDIWKSSHGVICLQVFQNIIPVEAYTREAAMIDAIGREQLCNIGGGHYYGIVATWNMQEKREFGRYLLYKALNIFFHEGEKQIFPHEI